MIQIVRYYVYFLSKIIFYAGINVIIQVKIYMNCTYELAFSYN